MSAARTLLTLVLTWGVILLFFRTVYALDLPLVPKAVLLALAWHANAREQCWPSIKALSADTGAKDRAIRSAIKFLETAGLIAVQRKYRTTNRYALFLFNAAPRAGLTGTTRRRNRPLNLATPQTPLCSACNQAPSATGDHGKCLNCWRKDNQHKVRS